MHAKDFDLPGALERLGGDEELFQDLVGFFLEDAPSLLEELRLGLQEGQAPVVDRAAHSLKGLAANFGATQAMEAAYAVEELGRVGNLAEARHRVLRLEEEIAHLQQALSSYHRVDS